MELTLIDWRGNTAGRIAWNPKTGAVTGSLASEVLALAADAVTRGSVVGHPYPTTHAITRPLHDPAQMAIVLGTRWRVPPELHSQYPQPVENPSDLPPGLVY